MLTADTVCRKIQRARTGRGTKQPPVEKNLPSEHPGEPENGKALPLDVPLTLVHKGPAPSGTGPQPTHHQWPPLFRFPPLVFTPCPHHPKGLPPGELLQVFSVPKVVPRVGGAPPDLPPVVSGLTGPGVLLRARDTPTPGVLETSRP